MFLEGIELDSYTFREVHGFELILYTIILIYYITIHSTVVNKNTTAFLKNIFKKNFTRY